MFYVPQAQAVHLDSASSLPSTFTDIISSDPQVSPMMKVGMVMISILQMTQCTGAGWPGLTRCFYNEDSKAK